jgi:hypothetical protein
MGKNENKPPIDYRSERNVLMNYWEKRRNQAVLSVELLIVGLESHNKDYFLLYHIHMCSGSIKFHANL